MSAPPPGESQNKQPQASHGILVIALIVICFLAVCLLYAVIDNLFSRSSYSQTAYTLFSAARPYIGTGVILLSIAYFVFSWRRKKHISWLGRAITTGPATLIIASFGLAVISSGFGGLYCLTLSIALVAIVIAGIADQRTNPPYYGAIVRYLQADRYEEALTFANRSVESNPNHWKSRQARAAIYCSLREWARAEQDAQLALTLKPTVAEVSETLGCSLIQQGNYERAVTILESAIKLFPKNGFMAAMLGKAQYRLGDYSGAAKTFELALKRNLEPKFRKLTANYYRASALEKLGQTEAAESAYRAMLQYKQYINELDKTLQHPSGIEDELMANDVAEIKRRLGIHQAESG
jgi:Flp pilus assembly protein TadD